MISTRNITCLNYITDAIITLHHGNNSKYMKIAEPPMFNSNAFLPVESATPYVYKFYKVYQRIYESGIVYASALMENSLETLEPVEKEPQIAMSINKKQLLIITFTGYFTSLFLFLTMELLKLNAEKINCILRGFVSFFIIIVYTNALKK